VADVTERRSADRQGVIVELLLPAVARWSIAASTPAFRDAPLAVRFNGVFLSITQVSHSELVENAMITSRKRFRGIV
jgi:hypothetical protein